MTDELKPIEVYEQDLEDLLATLNAVYHFTLSYDLFTQYQKLSTSVNPSPLTKRVQQMSNRVKGYLDDAEQERMLEQEETNVQ
jgi:hypothetical protein